MTLPAGRLRGPTGQGSAPAQRTPLCERVRACRRRSGRRAAQVLAGLGILLGGLALPGPATARDVSVAVEGCATIGPSVATALRLEVGSEWNVVVDEDAPLSVDSPRVDSPGIDSFRIQVRMAHCDAPRWAAWVSDPSGQLLYGPDEIVVGAFSGSSRARIAALWAAERLLGILERARHALGEPSAVPAFSTAATVGDVTPSPEAAEVFPGLTVGVGGAWLEDPAALAEFALLLRVGGFAQVGEWFRMGGSLAGGALFEPFAHTQPLFRLCAEPQLTLPLGARFFSIGVGPKACLSVSRHLRIPDDHWTSGVAVGGLVRFAFGWVDGIELGARIDADAWERDAFVELPEATEASLPWAGVIAGAVELSVH